MASVVCLRLNLFSQLYLIKCMEMCVFSLPRFPVMIVAMCTLSFRLGRIRLFPRHTFYHHYADLSEGIELMICLSDTFCLECVYNWASSLNHLSCNIWSCVFSAKLDSLMMILRLRVLDLIIIIKSQVWPIYHCRGLGDETMVCAVCFSVFLSSSNR